MNRTSPILDRFIDKLVSIKFIDGDSKVGVLEFDMPYHNYAGAPNRHMYSIWEFGKGRTFFYKTHVKEIREWTDN